MEFYTILTDIGKAKLANATSLGDSVSLKEIAVGDGGGVATSPQSDDTALTNEVWRADLNNISIDSSNANWIVCEGYIPSDVGDFTVREVGLFDVDGDMIAIGNYPDTYKPTLDSGSAKDLYIKVIIEVSDADVVELKIDPSVVLSTRKYVDDEVAKRALLNGDVSQTFKTKDIYINGNAIVSNDSDGWESDRSGTNIDHIWYDDSTDTWHFCSDAAYKSTGNSIGQFKDVKINNRYAVGRGVTIDSTVDNELDSLITDANVFGDTGIGLDVCSYKGAIVGDICLFTFNFKIINFDENANDDGFTVSIDLLTLLKRFDDKITGCNLNMYSTANLRLFDSDSLDYPELCLRVVAGQPDNEISFYNGDATLINHQVSYGYIVGMVAVKLNY